MESPASRPCLTFQEAAMPRNSRQSRQYRIKLSLLKDEFEAVEARALAQGKLIAIYSRELVVNPRQKLVPEINREALLELKRQGVNLNQIARTLNSAQLAGQTIPQSLLQRLDEVLTAGALIRAKLTGKEGDDS